MTDNELLLAISNLFDAKLSSNLAPIESRLRNKSPGIPARTSKFNHIYD